MKKQWLFFGLFIPFSSMAGQALPPAVQQIEKQGIQIIRPFTAPGGMKGWLGKYQGMGVTIYLTPDGQHAISGYMYDAQGKNLSEALIQQALYIPEGRAMWRKLQQASSLREGNAGAPRKIVIFVDPFCPYCKQLWQQMQPWVAAGKIQLQTLLVGIIRPDSARYAAAILSARDPAQAWRDYALSDGKTVPSLAAQTSRVRVKQLQYNQQLMDELGASATPAIYYMNAQNALQQVVGLPDKTQLRDMVGE